MCMHVDLRIKNYKGINLSSLHFHLLLQFLLGRRHEREVFPLLEDVGAEIRGLLAEQVDTHPRHHLDRALPRKTLRSFALFLLRPAAPRPEALTDNLIY